jgi:serine protease Do
MRTNRWIACVGLVWSLAAQPAPPAPSAPPAPLAPLAPRSPAIQLWTSGGSFLGVGVAEITSDRAKALNLKEEAGVEVTRVDEDSPAAKAGVQRGDVILEYNGQRVDGIEQLQRLIRETPAGRGVKVAISRNGAAQTLTAVVGSRRSHAKEFFGPDGVDMPEIHIPDMPMIMTTTRNARLGVEAESLGSQLAEYFGVKEGVLVRSVNKGSAAERAGVKAGDVILRVDKTKVVTAGEISSAVRASRSSSSFPIDLKRDHKDLTVTVNIEQAHNDSSQEHVIVREPPF